MTLPPAVLGAGPFPALLQQVYVDTAARQDTFAEMAAKGGYIVAVSNYRGCQLSEGRYTGYRALALGEHHDAYDTVEWLAARPRCTGKVGSYPIVTSQYSSTSFIPVLLSCSVVFPLN